jgi:predicted dehydrogenase
VALVSGERAKAEKYAQQYGINPKNIYNYQNYDSIRNNPEVDVIYIILPNGMHAEYSIRGAQAGKHIMCEKPMANTVEECQAMINAANKANRKLMIAYRAQYEPYNLATIQLAQSGKLGKLKSITSDHGRTLNPKDPADIWRMQKKLLDLCSSFTKQPAQAKPSKFSTSLLFCSFSAFSAPRRFFFS